MQNLLENNILIGVASPGYGTATDTFRTVGTSIEGINNVKRSMNNVFDFGFDVKNYDHTVGMFGPENIPSNSSAFITYQLSIIEEDEDDDGIRVDGSLIGIHPDCLEQSDDEGGDDNITHNTDLEPEDRILYSVDCLDEGELYPIYLKENLQSDGFVQQINVVSSDEDLAHVVDGGEIPNSHSFGTAEISTGLKTGTVTISTSVNGVGTGSLTTNVVNSLAQKKS